MAAEAGVDDVVLIAALALHRRMTEAELRHALGDRVYDAFAPNGLLTQHDAEDPDNLVHLGQTDQGEDVEINKRAAESDLLVYVNINLVAMDGGHKSVATGLASYRSLRHHHNPQTMQQSKSFMDQHRSELHSANWRMGRLIAESGVKVFQIETTLNNDTFPGAFRFLQKREWEWKARDRLGYRGRLHGPRPHAAPGTPGRSSTRSRRPHRMTSVQAGEVEAVHKLTTDNVWAAAGRGRRGPDRHPDHGPALHLPLQRQLDHEPDPGGVPRPRLLLQPLPGQAAGARGRRADHVPPHAVGVPPGAPPELHRLLRAGARRDHRPDRDGERFEEAFATDPWYIHLYRTGHAYHGVHPFYMWYWCAHALEHLGGVIIVGGDPRPCGGWASGPPPPWPTPWRWPSDVVGPSPTLTHLHAPPILMADVQ